jgi:phosphonate transport system permease protein
MVEAETTPHRSWRRRTPAQTVRRLLLQLAVAAAVVWSLRTVDIFWPWVVDAPWQIADLFARMVPPDFSSSRSIVEALLDTLNIAVIATILAIILAMPVALIAAQNTTPNRATLWLARVILVSSRSVNTLIWALLFVAIFGPGVLAGILAIAFRSIGFLGKLMGEAIEEIDRRPVEAIQATGGSRAKVILYGIVPQVVPNFFAVSILRWDINLRESAVLGLVGAGGIGLLLQSAIDTFAWQTVATILLAIIAMVLLGEAVSGWLRRKVI